MKTLTGNQTLLNRYVFLLSLVGVIMAAYVLQSFLRGSPIVCVNSGCELVRKNSVSYPLGIPVPAFGLLGYAGLAILSFLRTTRNNPVFLKVMLGITIFGISFVTWFTLTELFVIKAVCTWCALSTVNMFVVFLLVLKSYLFSVKK